MAELADALDLGSSSERSAGSIPVRRTTKQSLRQSHNTLYYECKIVAFSFGGRLNPCFRHQITVNEYSSNHCFEYRSSIPFRCT